MKKEKTAWFAIAALVLFFFTANALAGCMETFGLGGYSQDVPDRISYTKEFINDFSALRNADSALGFLKSNENISKKFALVGNTYLVPMDTMLAIKSPTQFLNWCANGNIFAANPQIKAIITDTLGVSTTVASISCPGEMHCQGGHVCIGVGYDGRRDSPMLIYHFMRPGLYLVKILFSRINTERGDWVLNEEFSVGVVNPLIIINGSKEKIVAFHDEETKKATLLWSIKNLSDFEIEIKEASALGCDASIMRCVLRGFTPGLKILPNQSAKILEEITIKNPKNFAFPMPATKKISLVLKYGDTNSLAEKIKESDATNLLLAFEETQRFRVKLFSREQTECVGANDELGQTGGDDAPKILLSWDWQNIGLQTCDQENRQDTSYVYCDPTQFSIELLRKLNEIDSLLSNEKKLYDNEVTALTSFKAYLIGDNYSADFRKDFDYYYSRAGFFNAASFYAQKNFNKYFNSTQPFLEFRPTDIESGLYDVQIEIKTLETGTGNELASLFLSGEPNAKITVNFTKIKDPDTQNPLYYLPFNGDIGKFGADADGSIGRKDYGLKFVGDKIMLDSQGSNQTDSNSGAKTIQTVFTKSIAKTNLENRGMLLNISRDRIEFAPSKATPVLAKTTAKAMRAELFYVLKSQTQSVDSGKGYLAFWTEIASSINCTDFLGNPLFYRRQDAKADETNCSVKAGTQKNAFGFEWAGIPMQNENKELFLQTIFFTPTGQSFVLENACPDSNSMWFYGPNGSIAATNIAIDYPPGTIESLQQTLDLIKNEKACISVTNNEMKVWWNFEKISKALDNAKRAIPQTIICTQKT